MKKARKIALALLVFITILITALAVFLFTKKPSYERDVAISGLSKDTTVYFDTYGIPHIYAQNELDAQRVLGYVHAQERLWQMELMRRIAPGKLSEIFGSVMVKNDKFFATLGMNEYSIETVKNLDANSEEYKLATAYLDGINQYINEGELPVECNLLGITPKHFTLVDIHNILGFMSVSFAMGQKTDPLLTDIKNSLGIEYLHDFGINGEWHTKQLKTFPEVQAYYIAISQAIENVVNKLPVAPFIGSNSWVIGAEKTKNKKVLFANDPHIMFSQPGTWFEAHIHTPKHEIYGYYIAGVPFPLLGHNREYAYGLTMFENDDLDFFEEKISDKDSTFYLTIYGERKFNSKNISISVKDSASVNLQIKKSIHGPIVSDVLLEQKVAKPIAMSWMYLQSKNELLKAVYGLSHAKSLDDFYSKVGLIHAPGLNVMYGDAKNNIAWIAAGKLYKLDDSTNANIFRKGNDVKDNFKDFLPFSKNPHAINPPWNYVYSANNQPEPIDGYLYPGYYLPKDRAERIDFLLSNKNNWTRSDVEKMMLDDQSTTMPELAKNWVTTIALGDFSSEQQQLLFQLSSWNGNHSLQSIEATFFSQWIYFYLKNTFQDELGEDKFKVLLGTHIIKQTITAQSINVDSPWWDNVKTKNKIESQTDILTKSFNEAFQNLKENLSEDIAQWQWQNIHQLEVKHPIGKVKIFSGFFNIGPNPVSGGNEVINNTLFTYTNTLPIEVKGGPSTRRIIDFSDVENSVSILPTGNSGNPMSKHYDDQVEMYTKGKFRKMLLNKKEIEKVSTKELFTPKR